jgi:hypothetical protein
MGRACALFVCCTLACADDEYRSGVSTHAAVTALSESELKTVCRWLSDNELRISFSRQCTAFAAMNSETKQQCVTMRDECMRTTIPAARTRILEDRAACDTLTLSVPREYCTSTVGELEECARDTVEEYWAYTDRFSCAKPRQWQGDLYPPDSCQEVFHSCFPTRWHLEDDARATPPQPSD